MAIDFSMRVLVVDDMAVMRKMVKKILKDLGFAKVDDSANGKIAFEMIKDAHATGSPFQFIVSDWNMPEMSGIELLQKIRADETFKKLPFLMVTAEGEKDNLIIAIKAGVTNFIIKPFTPDVFREKVEKIFT